MGITKKAKITFTCEPDLKDGLELWAQNQSRTLSNLVEMVVRAAYETYQSNSDATDTKKPPASKAKRSSNKE